MKKRVCSFMLAAMFAMTSINCIYAEDAPAPDAPAVEAPAPEAPAEPEPPTEAPTEKPTEAPTEKPTEAPTEKPTEPTTAAPTETTTKADGKQTINESIAISIDDGDSMSLEKYLDDDLEASNMSWSTSDKSTCTVTSSGRITGKDDGDCKIYATYSTSTKTYSYTFNVEVERTSSSDDDDDDDYDKSITIDVGETYDLYDHVDDDYDEEEYDWRSSSRTVATVTDRGVVKGIKSGTTVVRAEIDDDDEDVEYRFKITVDDDDNDDDDDDNDDVAKKTSWEIYLSEDDEFDVSDILEDDPEDYDWDVRDDEIADVDEEDGIISAYESGDTKIYAEGDDDYTFSVKVDNDYSIETMKISGSDVKDLEDYLDYDLDEYDFESGRKDVVTVSSNGKVTGKAKGIGYILCEHEDGEIVQIFVTVSNVTKTTTTTTTTKETTTETTTQATTVAAVAFDDISSRPWAVEAINAMAAKGIIKGVGNNKFSPDANCKRCDFAIVLINILGLNSEIATTNYADVKLGEYYYNYVGIAKKYGIESGINADSFRPTVMITREDIMVMTYKGLVQKGYKFNTDTSVLTKYTDAGNVAPANKEALAALINSGVVTGTSATTLDATSNITRAQMAVLMNNVVKFVDGEL